jgi:hypothetical protein
VASLLPHERDRAQVQANAPASVTAQEMTDLRDQVSKLQTERDLYRALADERAQAIEQLHLTFRLALNPGEQPGKRRLWRRRSAPGN